MFLNDNIQYLYEKYIEIKAKRIHKENSWFTRDIKISIDERNRAYERWKRFKTNELYNIFKTSRRNVNTKIRIAKCKYYEDKFKSAICSKRKWCVIRSMGIGNNSTCNENIINVNQLNTQFLNISMPQANHTYYNSAEDFPISNYSREHASRFEFKNIIQEDVLKSISDIKSDSVGHDGIHPKFIKIILPYILPQLTHLMNTIITTSTFPLTWKQAKIMPIQKADKNYRPIAILPFFSKVFEKLIHAQMNKHLNEKSILTNRQSGFRPKHSCITTLIDVCEELRSRMDSDMISFLILLDHSKAFDTVDHNILCQKLKHMCHFSNTAVKLISSYLVNRSQFVCFGSERSETCQTKRGVPQGSILGPLLYTIYSNDLPSKLDYCGVHMYADDVQLYISCLPSQINDCIGKLNHDLENINKWASINGLCLNAQKSKAIVISKQNYDQSSLPTIHIGQSTIELVESAKNLGIVINNKLTWSNHINAVCGKTYSILRNLWISQYYTPIHVRMLLAKTYLLPTFLYGCELFASCDSICQNKLKVMFNNVARYIYGRTRFSSISQFSYQIYKVSFSSLLKCRSLQFLHKIIYNKQPQYLYDRLVFSRTNRGYKINSIRYRKLISERHFFVNAIRLWNDLPSNIQTLSNARHFNSAIFAHFA